MTSEVDQSERTKSYERNLDMQNDTTWKMDTSPQLLDTDIQIGHTHSTTVHSWTEVHKCWTRTLQLGHTCIKTVQSWTEIHKCWTRTLQLGHTCSTTVQSWTQVGHEHYKLDIHA